MSKIDFNIGENINIMKVSKRGQIVKFHTPLEDEDPGQLYVVLEYIGNRKKPTIKMLALNTGFAFPPVSVVWARDLIVDMEQTLELDFHLGKW